MVGQTQVQLAMLDLDRGAIEQAMQRLEESQATTHEREWEQRARIHQALARIHSHHGDRAAARAALLKAEELFERMGLALESQTAQAAAMNAADMYCVSAPLSVFFITIETLLPDVARCQRL